MNGKCLVLRPRGMGIYLYRKGGGRKVWTFEVLEKWGHVVELDKLIHSHI